MPVERLVSHRFSLDEAAEAFRAFDAARDREGRLRLADPSDPPKERTHVQLRRRDRALPRLHGLEDSLRTLADMGFTESTSGPPPRRWPTTSTRATTSARSIRQLLDKYGITPTA